MWARQWTLQEVASDTAAGGSGGVGAGAGGDAAAGAGGSSAAPAQGTAAPASALAAGASAQPAPGGPAARIPAKFHVKGEDGALNLEASLAKWSESHGHLERRLGTGELPPKSAEEYQVEKLPEGAPAWDEFKAAPENASFLKAAHAKGMTNAQLEFVLGEFYQRAPALVEGAKALDAEAAITALRETWKEQPAFDTNMRAAFRAAQAAAQRAGVPVDEVHRELGNNPLAIRLLAALGADLGEGTSAPQGVPLADGETIEALERSEAYTNPRHPQHEQVSRKIRAYYEAKFGALDAR